MPQDGDTRFSTILGKWEIYQDPPGAWMVDEAVFLPMERRDRSDDLDDAEGGPGR